MFSLAMSGLFLTPGMAFAITRTNAASASVGKRDLYQEFKSNLESRFGIRYNIDDRFRYEFINNAADLTHRKDDGHHYLRNRSRFGLGVKPLCWFLRNAENRKAQSLRDIELYARFVNEFRVYMDPGRKVWPDEILLDQLYIDLPKALDIPFSLRFGRQDWHYGEGFIISDGTPLDGTRTRFFDGARISWHVDEMLEDWFKATNFPGTDLKIPETDIDLLFAYNRNENYFALNERNDANNHAWRKQSDKLNDRDELLVGFYLTSKLWDEPEADWFNRLQIEAYYIFKAEYAYHSDDIFTLDFERDARIHTFGGAVSGSIFDNETHSLSYRTEWAGQVGRHGTYLGGIREKSRIAYYGDRVYSLNSADSVYPEHYSDGAAPIVAAGGYGWLEEHMKKIPFTDKKMPFDPKIKVLAGFLSGDDGVFGSKTDTGWQPMFNREDKLFGEDAIILSKVMGLEDGESWFSNLQMYYAGLNFKPFEPLPEFKDGEHDIYDFFTENLKNINANIGYKLLLANSNPFADRDEFGGGCLRGQSLGVGAAWKLNDYVTLKFKFDSFFPRNYYSDSSTEEIGYYRPEHGWHYDQRYSYLVKDKYYDSNSGYQSPAFFARFEVSVSF